MKRKSFFLFVFVLLIATCQPPPSPTPGGSAASHSTKALKRGSLIPTDTSVVKGRLDNGLTYYIRRNLKPEKRAELRLVVNVGSVLEQENEQGLAHFLEHMAFNGTRHFARQELIQYIESIGMRFGPDLNAYTGFDETVYILQVPTDRDTLLEKGFLVLSDWAQNISLESREIDKERGVIKEEWRLDRGADARMRDREIPFIYHNSLYARRLPIGQMAVVDTFRYETLRQFYRHWYRPDLMAVVAVGDFEVRVIEEHIAKYFAQIAPALAKNPRQQVTIPDHKETLTALVTDPEATQTIIQVLYKMAPEPESRVRDYRRSLVENLYNNLFNKRLAELVRLAEPPFTNAWSQKGRLARGKDYYSIGAVVRDNEVDKGLRRLLTELRRVQLYGFTTTEFERARKELLRNMERAYLERNKTQSSRLADEYIRNFLLDEPIPGIEYEYALTKRYLPTIKLKEVNALAGKWVGNRSRVVLYEAPDKPDTQIPTAAHLLSLFDSISDYEVLAYIDRVSEKPLIENLPQPGRIVAEREIAAIGVTELTLSNGMRVICKPTDFKNDEVVMSAFSPGGHSLVNDSDYIAAVTATPLIGESGLGELGIVELQKKLSGKVVRVRPAIGEIAETFSGGSSPEDLETMFQLLYLCFTAPRKDTTAYKSYYSKTLAALTNKDADPLSAFGDTLRVTLSQYHFRARPWSTQILSEMDLEKSFHIYCERFADASDFTFFFVGNLDLQTIRELSVKYLAPLPALRRAETWRDINLRPPQGVIRKAVYRGLEKQSYVQMVFTGDFEFTRQNRYNLGALVDILNIRLREQIREEKSGSYGVSVRQTTKHYPRPEYQVTIQFGCDPERVQELVGVVFEQVAVLQDTPVSDADLNKVREMGTRSYEVNLKDNRFWADVLNFYYFNQEDPLSVLEYPKFVAGLNAAAVQAAARRYLNTANYVQVVLYPEK